MRAPPLAALRAAWPLLLGLVTIGVAGGAALLVRRREQALPAQPTVRATGASVAKTLRVPHLAGTIVLDSDTDDPGWTSVPGPARTGPFEVAGGVAARPYSDARLVWGDGHLYLALYAADEDIETVSKRDDGAASPGDSFRLLFSSEGDDRQFSIEVSPNGTLTESASRRGRTDPTWRSGAHVAREMDGTPDDPADDDEEWVIEMAVPFDAIGLTGKAGESIGFAVSRCDTPKNEERICASWGAPSGEGAGARGRLLLGP